MPLHYTIFICVAVFLGGFFDSIAGGGGLITLPAYLFIGLPADVAFVCNKFGAGCGTTFSAINFFRSGAVKIKVAAFSGIFAFCASQIGTRLVLSINPIILKTVIFILLPVVGILVLVKRDLGNVDASDSISKKKKIFFAIIIGVCVGFYDGVFGPGTGTFAIIAYTALMKFDAKTAAGSSKILNLFSNYSSLMLGILSGKIIYSLVIPAAIAGILGNYIGSTLAIKNGNKIIRPMMLFVVVLLFINLLYNFIIMMWR